VSGEVLAEDDWCRRVQGGSPGTGNFAVNLSAAHANSRFFGMQRAYSVADQALAEALDTERALSVGAEKAVEVYAKRLGSVCAVHTRTKELGAARVEMFGDVALVHPGLGPVTFQEGTTAVAIDLRHLPAVDGLRQALVAAVRPVLGTPVGRPVRAVRWHQGMTDEVFNAQNVYWNTITTLPQPPILDSGSAELPLALLIGRALAPEAAEFAGTLRMAGRAWLLGEDVPAAVAESRWHGLGEIDLPGKRKGEQGGSDTPQVLCQVGLAIRTSDLLGAGGRWPDLIPADFATDEPEEYLGILPGLGLPSSMPSGPASRPPVTPISPFGDVQPPTLLRGDVRAALLTVHGATRLFFPYFHVVGDGIDNRLLETLDTADSLEDLDRALASNLLRRFGEVLQDGHNYVYDLEGSADDVGVFPVLLDQIGGQPVVYRSLASEIEPGDTITMIDGEPIQEWFATEFERTSAATDGHRFVIASRRLLRMQGPREIGLRSPDGNTRTVMVEPYPWSVLGDLDYAHSLRPAGWLSDLGAPELYYINLSGEVLTSLNSLAAALYRANFSEGLILDMRHYPGLNHYVAAMWLMCRPFSSPVFRVPELAGPDLRSISARSYGLSPGRVYCGRMVLLVGPATVSAAENFSTMLVDGSRVTVVGRQSAGTNGNITGVQLPGAFAFAFTGMDVVHVDGSTFHGIGILPDVEVAPEAGALRDGRDAALEAAIAVLRGEYHSAKLDSARESEQPE
jgi:hypothetical protein